MALITLQETMEWLKIEAGVFSVTAGCDTLIFTSDQGTAEIEITDGTYDGDELAAALESAMNADDTLTGGTITFSVAHTDGSFTIDAGSGHTIGFTNAGSDGGILFGFVSDRGPAQTITSDITAGDPTADIQRIVDDVDVSIKRYCRRDLESTAYRLYLDGNGERALYLPNYPVTELRRVAFMEGKILLYNTGEHSHLRYAIDNGGITLFIVGGPNQGSDGLLFSENTTVEALAAAINSLGKGWTATVARDGLSFDLRESVGFSWTGRTYLHGADDPDESFELNPATGALYRYRWPPGIRNVLTDFTGGYIIIPDDLKLAALVYAEWLHQRKEEESFGLKSYNSGGVTKSFADVIPPYVLNTLNRYRRTLV